ncbi:MAG: SDR family NAD(P)-dependent oxidoreductase [Oligoflexia bacterium]|nr:SDR family NAD(P)-dependent oxidoreductase [Oligoflexia bacterium]MBF0366538.1 SDR family NAD(P)-dependent oxidoreductase [Oligoflexia bacterium]
MRRYALVTGATSGIGLATAKLLAENNFNLVICGRRKERLALLEKEIVSKNSECKVSSLCFDVSKREEVEQAISSLSAEFQSIELLINNAGNAHGLASIENASLEDFEKMIDTNLKGIIYISQEIIPKMIAMGRGQIINVGSIAGKEVYPMGSVYCASKHGADALTKGMRMDLNKFGIKVSSINPGLVKTEFSLVRFKGDQERADSVYKGYTPLVAEDVAETILFMATRPLHVNIADVIIFPTAQASSTIVKKDL